jgi:SulP family sulfate permease
MVQRSAKYRLFHMLPFMQWKHMVDRCSTRADMIAGLTGALIVLPQGVAFATIAGMPPEYGLYAAMLPAIIAALFGSSWHLVSGPTTAISIAVFAAISPLADPGSPEFIGMVLTLTFLTGLFQLILGLARMGVLVNFISHTVVIGFTAGAALLIAASQVKNFFGIDIARGAPFHVVIEQTIAQFGNVNLYVTLVALLTLAAGIFAKRFVPKLPYMIVAMVVGSIAAFLIGRWVGTETSQIKTVGALPAHLPPIVLPDLSYATLHKVLFPALVVTLLALTEAVSISRAIAAKSEQRIDGNQEFIGQGLSNLVGSFFSSYASCGSFNRSGVNYAAGAQTPMATVYASLILVLILFLVAPVASYLPTAAMAGILMLVAWGLIDFQEIASLLRSSRSETVVLWTTLLGTVIDLEKGIFFGILLSLSIYLYRVSRPGIVTVVPAKEEGAYHFVTAEDHPQCPQLSMFATACAKSMNAARFKSLCWSSRGASVSSMRLVPRCSHRSRAAAAKWEAGCTSIDAGQRLSNFCVNQRNWQTSGSTVSFRSCRIGPSASMSHWIRRSAEPARREFFPYARTDFRTAK